MSTIALGLVGETLVGGVLEGDFLVGNREVDWDIALRVARFGSQALGFSP